MSDYSCEWPLWLDDGLAGEEFAEQVGLTSELRRDLVSAQAFFEERFHWDSGWRGAGDDRRYTDQMVDACFRLKRELGDAWSVELDLWPVTDEAILTPLRRGGLLPRTR